MIKNYNFIYIINYICIILKRHFNIDKIVLDNVYEILDMLNNNNKISFYILLYLISTYYRNYLFYLLIKVTKMVLL